MALSLHCRRSKIFQLTGNTEDGKGQRTFLIYSGTTAAAPNWVKETLTYQQGVKDKSILDLTPVAQPATPAAPTSTAPTSTAPALAEFTTGDLTLTDEELEAVQQAEKNKAAAKPKAKEPEPEPKDPMEMSDEELEAAQAKTRVQPNRLPAGVIQGGATRKR